MNWRTIPPLIVKDLTIFFRNRFFAFITILALGAYIGVYFAMPSRVDETIEIGLYAPTTETALTAILEEEGVNFVFYDSAQALEQAVLDQDVQGGFGLPDGMLQEIAAGRKPTVNVYARSDTPEDVTDAMVVIVESLSLALTGERLNLDVTEETLGPDMGGEQIPPRDRMLPLFAILVVMMETMGLASLIAEEIQTGTIRALLITPMSVRELFVGKGIISVGMTFFQAAILMLFIGGLKQQPLIILTVLLLSALLVTGIGFLMASVGKDMLSVMSWGIMVIILLGVPAFGVMFPGTVTGWAKAIPSYYLADTVHQVVNFGAGWSQVSNNLLILLGSDLLLLWLGVVVLRRKFS